MSADEPPPDTQVMSVPIPDTSKQDPYCFGLHELPDAQRLRRQMLTLKSSPPLDSPDLFNHLAYGLAYTTGSALGSAPPSNDACLAAYRVPNKAGLTAGSRAWSKHSHRSQPSTADEEAKDKRNLSEGWWGVTKGPVAVINENALSLFHKVMGAATWRNLHWLPHQVLVYEVRVAEGYGMRWSQDQTDREDDGYSLKEERQWIFRGFLEPTMENGHELKWRHPV